MDKVVINHTFTDITEWLEWFGAESFPPMRNALLDGLFSEKRFENPKGLTGSLAHKTRLRYIMLALSLKGVKVGAVEHGLKLIFLHIIKDRRGHPWPRVFSNKDILGFLKFLEKVHRTRDFHSCNVSDWLKSFFHDVLFNLRPDHNSATDNSQIVRTIFACDQIEILSRLPLWRGREEVIAEFVKKLKREKIKDPFSFEGWKEGVSDHFAAHLAAAGKLGDWQNK